MLGESPEEQDRRERARFANWLFASAWTTGDVTAHEGFARDRFAWLLGSEKQPPLLPGIGRKLERLAWSMYRCFGLLQAARRQLDLTAA